ncbi:MAG: SLBB domain-containing protein [Opitutales bacterium]|nr:SLBB domain-containing protein [Opitutales bacterium]
MKTNDPLQELARLASENKPETFEQWLRIGMDSGGIAAGAERLLSACRKLVEDHNLPCEIQKSGSYGYAYLDPLVEIKSKSLPPVLYGRVTPEKVSSVTLDHLSAEKLADDHIIASRQYGTALTDPTQSILVLDTSCEEGDKTKFFQSSFQDEIASKLPDSSLSVVRALDMGIYHEGLVVQLLPSRVTYTNVLSRDISRIVTTSLGENKVLKDLLWTKPDPQCRIVLRNCGLLDPEHLGEALARGTYRGLAKALAKNSPDEAIREIEESGLRGRGGAGFPTGLKWKLTREPKADRKFVICNADEGDPGAFMDRSILEGDPHAVLEGLLIAGYAVGANKGYFYVRAEYPLAIQRIQKALEDARQCGLLGENILGSGWSFDAEIRLGAGAFVCGEETALIASIEGCRGSPSPRPPYPSVEGLWGYPTCINNVETLAAAPWILDHGAEAYAQHGTGSSRGTKVFAVTGKVQNAQLVEVPMGTSVHEIIYPICGGVQDQAHIKGVQTGGPSGGIIPENKLETPVTYENLMQLGSIMGSGGMLVMDERDCMVDVAAFYLKFCVDESCGKCAPCRVGGYQMLQLLLKITRGRGSVEDIKQIERICQSMQKASLCGLGQTAANPILSTLRYFRDEYIAYIEGGTAYARKRKKLLSQGESLQQAS